MIGASDNFTLKSPTGGMMVYVFEMFSHLFIRQLREKVLRGMMGAARRKTSVSRLPLGYKLVPECDTFDKDGAALNELAIHEDTMKYVRLAGHWYANCSMSTFKITRELSRLKVDVRMCSATGCQCSV